MVDFERKERYDLADLIEIVKILRGPGGCMWDREQDHHSIRRNFIEEVYEVIEAIDNEDAVLMQEELGDVLFQVAFHAQIEQEKGVFDINDVADGICKKMIYRHPHVFGTAKADSTEQVLVNWDAIKRAEKGQETYTDTLQAVAKTLPALWRAEKLQKKAEKSGFTWPDISGAAEKLAEEQQELQTAVAEQSNIREEVGDVLFAAVNVARFAGIDPEEALHETCEKYISRFAHVEQTALSQGREIADMTLAEMVQAWNEAKQTKRNVQEDKTHE